MNRMNWLEWLGYRLGILNWCSEEHRLRWFHRCPKEKT